MNPELSQSLLAIHNQQPIVDVQAEQAYRHELVNGIVEASVGSVGIMTSADFSPEDKRSLQTTLNARNSDKNVTLPTGGGWQNWGERPIAQQRTGDPLLEAFPDIRKGVWNEEVHFLELPDGQIDVRYGFFGKNYQDGTGRPGNVLMVGFLLPKNTALQLREAVQADPSFISDVVEAEAMAIGISDKHWRRYMEPNNGFDKAPDMKDRELVVVDHNPDVSEANREKLLYGENKSILPVTAPQVPIVENQAQSAGETASISQEDALEKYRELAQEYVKTQFEFGATTDDVLDDLVTDMTHFEKEMDAGRERPYGHAYMEMNAYAETYSDVLHKEMTEKGMEYAYERFTKIMDSYLTAAISTGKSLSEVTTPYAKTQPADSPTSSMMSEMMLIGDVLRDVGHPLTPKDYVSVLNHVKRARRT